MADKKVITTRKWMRQSSTTKRLPLVIFQEAKCFKEILKYQIPSGLIFYQASFNDNKMIIDFGFDSGKYSSLRVTKENNREKLMFTYAMRSNHPLPKQFKKPTAISEENVNFDGDKLIVDFDVSSGNGAPVTTPKPVDPIDTKALAKEIVNCFNDKYSYQLANEVTQQLTRSDKFMNRIAETVGFKLASTISTRTNRMSETMKSTIKDQSDKTEKRITHNVYDLFKEAGWLK